MNESSPRKRPGRTKMPTDQLAHAQSEMRAPPYNVLCAKARKLKKTNQPTKPKSTNKYLETEIPTKYSFALCPTIHEQGIY